VRRLPRSTSRRRRGLPRAGPLQQNGLTMSTREVPVVVVGAGIAGLSCAHRLASQGLGVLVLEASSRAGGKIETIARDGVQFEPGPSTLLANRRPTLDLIDELGLAGDVIDAAPLARNRWITLNGQLEVVPHSLL